MVNQDSIWILHEQDDSVWYEMCMLYELKFRYIKSVYELYEETGNG